MPASNPTAQKLADTMLTLLPQDGAPVLNRVMRVMLSRELERPVEAKAFFEARDQLFKAGKIGRLRGQGGQLFLTQKSSGAEPPSGTVSEVEWTEAKLMEPLRRFLEGPFRDGLDLPKGSECIVHNTSAMGPVRGRWARPDYILVSAMRFKLMPGSQIDVHSFELKTETGATDLAVYEALAQTRFTHFGHLVWHLPNGSKAEARLVEIQNQCEEHGIGLIRMPDPDRPKDCTILVDPVRKQTLSATVDGFLESRLTSAQCQQVKRAIGGELE
jgi:hypothetical protein